jgi:hypothetical protein
MSPCRRAPLYSFLIFILAGFFPGPTHASLQGDVQNMIAQPIPVNGGFPFRECFLSTAKETNLPVSLLIAVAKGESNFNPRAVSNKNAIGVMQIRWPLTTKELGVRSRNRLFEPCLNIRLGGKYLASLIKRYDGEVYRGIAAYNYGPGRIHKDGEIPPGAHDYVDYIYSKYVSLTGSPPRGARLPELVFRSSELDKQRGKLVLTPYEFRFYSYTKEHFRDLKERVFIKNVFYEIEKNGAGRYQVVAYYKRTPGARKKIADRIRFVTGWEIDINPSK